MRLASVCACSSFRLLGALLGVLLGLCGGLLLHTQLPALSVACPQVLSSLAMWRWRLEFPHLPVPCCDESVEHAMPRFDKGKRFFSQRQIPELGKAD